MRIRSFFFLLLGFLSVSCSEDEIDILPNTYNTYRFATWNIAHFNLGSGVVNNISTVDKYNLYYPIYQDIIKSVNADFFNVCEFETPFFAGHPDYSTKRVLFPDYSYYKDDATSFGAHWIAFFSHLPLNDVKEVAFESHPPEKYRYYLVGDMTLGKRDVKVICTHLTHSTPNEYAPKQVQQLINDFSTEQNVIILADWNSGPTEFQPLIDAGYSLANHGPNWMQTYYNKEYYEGVMDNIAVKGGEIKRTGILKTNDYASSILSDHYLLYCDVVFK